MRSIRSKIKPLALVALAAASVGLTTRGEALPIGFGYNQGSTEFREIRDEHFSVYFDKRAPQDARLALRSLNAARPHMERWFNVTRRSPLIVNISAASSNASFANFVTDSIELQTMGQGGRDLAWHEYTHATMYRELDNWFGPAGAILHLPWMEAWFLEGLAEAVSVSIGSDEQSGIERFHALTGQWPSWDRIHSLYASGPFSYRGYATSGGFVSWIMRRYGADKITLVLKTLRDKTMPWYWPWALTPFNGFWPMDTALKAATGHTGEELYGQYKAEAERHWKSLAQGEILAANVTAGETASSPWAWTAAAGKTATRSEAPEDSSSYQIAETPSHLAYTEEYFPRSNERRVRLRLKSKQTASSVFLNRPQATWIDGPWISGARLTWHETTFDGSRICQAPLNEFKNARVHCPVEVKMPGHLRYLGAEARATDQAAYLVFAREHERVTGNSYSLFYFDPQSAKGTDYKWTGLGRPLSFATAGGSSWILTGGDAWRYLIKTDHQKRCGQMMRLDDFTVRILDSSGPVPQTVIYANDGFAVKNPALPSGQNLRCHAIASLTSPLLEAVTSSSPLSFNDAVAKSDTWTRSRLEPVESGLTVSEHGTADQISGSEPEESQMPKDARAKWRGRPIFVFPWIGADDALGPQIGVISVPLMDEMQNETLRATMLVGVASRFPYQDVTLTTTRFKPTWSLGVFRAQTYNGRYKDRVTGLPTSGYLEEKGVHVDGSRFRFWKYLSITTDWGLKSSHLQRYIGPAKRVGHLNEPYAAVRFDVHNGGRLFAGMGVRGRHAPPGLNKVFHYDVLSASVNAGSKVGDGKIEIGADASRVRGPKRRDLQEMYVPLKTLIPGNGGDYNQTSYAVTDDYGLFTPVFGENQARGKLLATHPVIKDIDKFSGLVYLSRLDLSGFVNYGTAWRNSELPRKSALIAAHGYNLDLFMDNKGVNFNLGLGTGQVIGKNWQGYWTFGFDALF